MKGVNKPCAQSGCPGIAVQGSSRCAAHTMPVLYNRPSPSTRGYDRTWQAIRSKFLRNNPICESCGSVATEAHHTVALASGGTHDTGNLVALCKRCHSRITRQRQGG